MKCHHTTTQIHGHILMLYIILSFFTFNIIKPGVYNKKKDKGTIQHDRLKCHVDLLKVNLHL